MSNLFISSADLETELIQDVLVSCRRNCCYWVGSCAYFSPWSLLTSTFLSEYTVTLHEGINRHPRCHMVSKSRPHFDVQGSIQHSTSMVRFCQVHFSAFNVEIREATLWLYVWLGTKSKRWLRIELLSTDESKWHWLAHHLFERSSCICRSSNSVIEFPLQQLLLNPLILYQVVKVSSWIHQSFWEQRTFW